MSTSNRPFEFQKRSPNSICAYKETRSIAMGVNDPDRSSVLRDPHLNPLPGQGEADAKAPGRVEFRAHGVSLVPSITLKFTEPEKTFLCMDLL
jgi:hypothetical protein